MNKLIFFALIFSAGMANGQVEKRVDSKITKVTVFLNRAQVTRQVQTKIESGKTNIVVQGLTSQLDQQSIQVTGTGKFTILGISHQQNFVNEFNIPAPLKILKDSLTYYQDQIQLEQNQKDILNKEEQLLLSNQKIGGTNQNLSAAELKAMADFYRTRLNEILTLRSRHENKVKKLNERVVRIQKQMREQNELFSRNTSEVVVSLSSDVSTTVELELSYVVGNAAWQPVYDVRATDTKNPIQLNYKANIYQSTGEEWKNVKLALSTGNPSLGGVKPDLNPWYLNFYNPVIRSPVYKKEKSAPAAEEVKADKGYFAEAVEAETAADYTSIVQTTLNTEFAIGLPYTVASSNKPTLVDIGIYSMKADFLYAVAPKLDKDAFLMARITGWEDYNLLLGEANIFFEGTFVTKAFINPNEIKDTLSISLGRDKRVVVQREKLKDFTSKKLIGSAQREAYAYQISVRNTKDEPIKILIEDQIPVSQNNQIEVTLTDGGNGKHTVHSGKLEWQLVLTPREEKKIGYKYEVKYPKDRIISGLN